MNNRIRLSLFAVVTACAFTVSACAAPADAPDESTAEARAEVRVTADDVARVAEGDKYALDLPAHVYRFDPSRGPIDFSRVAVDDVSMTEILARSGVSSEMSGKAFTLGGRAATSADDGQQASRPSAKRWCSVEVWIAPEGPDDIFRIGHVWVWKSHC